MAQNVMWEDLLEWACWLNLSSPVRGNTCQTALLSYTSVWFFCLYSSLKSKSKALSNSSCMIKPKTTRSLEGVRGVTLTLNKPICIFFLLENSLSTHGFKRANMQVISLCIIKHKAQPDIPIHPHHSSYSDDLTSPSKE